MAASYPTHAPQATQPSANLTMPAERLFAQVAKTGAVDSLVREDAAILETAARSRFGGDVTSLIDQLRAADPYSRYALQVAVMDELRRHTVGPAGNTRQRLHGLAQEVRQSQNLFDYDDRWLASALRIFGLLGV